MATSMRLALLLLGLTGCARAQVVAWDDKGFTVCCKNKICGQEKLDSLATARCPGARAVAGHMAEGASTVSSSFGVATIETAQYPCAVYRCDN